MPKFLDLRDDARNDPEEVEQIEWLNHGKNLIFKLKNNPAFVFKFYRNYDHPGESYKKVEKRFNNMIKAKKSAKSII